MKKSTKRILVRRIASAVMSAILTVVTVVCALPKMTVTAYAAGTGKSIQLGANVLNDNVNTANAPIVYYDNNSDVWRVVGYDGTGVAGTQGTITLIANGNLAYGYYDSDSPYSNNYSGSNLQNMIGTIEGRLLTAEASAVVERTLEGGSANYDKTGYDDNKISGDLVSNAVMWPLSAAEANVLNADLRRLDGGTGRNWVSDYWWLRSPGYNDGYAAVVYGDGHVYYYVSSGLNREYGVRPAFNLNLSSIIFTSAAVGGKSSGTVGAGALTAPAVYNGTEWKFTVLDGSRSFSATLESSGNVNAGDNISISYEDATVGTNEYVSAILLNSSGELLYYGRIAGKSSGSADGTADITIPAGLADGTYTFKVFSEQYNGDKLTDYVSAFSSISITVGSSGGSNTSVPTVVRTSEPEPPINWMQEVEDKINAAIALGGPQTVYIKGYDTLSYHVLEMLKEHPQITLVSEFTYDGLDYRITIPGSAVELDPSIKWYGPKYLFPMFYKYGTDTQPAVQAYLDKYERPAS